MKKYHCPYCGKNSLSWVKKIPLSYKQQLMFFWNYRCPHCSKEVDLKLHISVYYFFYFYLISWGLLIFCYVFMRENLSVLLSVLIADTILELAFSASQVLFSKFVCDAKKPESFVHMLIVTFSKKIKNPKFYFHRTAVLIAEIEGDKKRFPIRVELKHLENREGRCSFYVIGEEEVELVQKRIRLLDNNELIGVGTVVR